MSNFWSMPDDLIIEILLRLPVKSLKIFKCVCKSWFSLIEDADFVKKHYTANSIRGSNLRALVRNFDAEDAVIINDTRELGERMPLSLRSKETMLAGERICIPLEFMQSGSQGLIVLVDRMDVAILNPATREYKCIPESVVRHRYSMVSGSTRNVLGFGYDSKTDDFKVVRIVQGLVRQEVYRIGWDLLTHIELYSLNNNSWKEIHDPYVGSKGVEHTPFSTYINGCYHWFLGRKQTILVFDMTQESFRIMGAPIRLGAAWNRHLRLFDDCLAVFEMSHDCYTIWLMKDYGINESWCKHLVLGPIQDVRGLIGMWKTGEWFFTNYNDQLALYNPHNNAGEVVRIRDLGLIRYPRVLTVIIFNESLRSIDGRNLNSEII